MANGSMTQNPTHYEVLGLPETIQNDVTIPIRTLRGAYKRALLQNHPDKRKNALDTSNTVYTVDQISTAFTILANVDSRREYDTQQKLSGTSNKHTNRGEEVFKTGVEVLDLDDLEEDEEQNVWYRSCRCGDSRGFLIAEADLEEAAEEGEISVGCRGCSLWIKVLFGVVEEGSTGVVSSDGR